MKDEQKAEEITRKIYNMYGSYTGHLFGITPDLRDAVKAIVDTTIAIRKEESIDKQKVIDAINRPVTICGKSTVDKDLVLSAVTCERKRILHDLGLEE